MKKSSLKKRLIIREGYHLMRQHGYQGASVDEIVKNLEIPKGSFYYYFKNKEDFALEVLEYYINIVEKRIERILTDPDISPKQRIIKLYSDNIDNYTNLGGTIYGNFAATLMLELGEKNQQISEVVMKFYENIKSLHIICLNQARKAGEIDRNADIEKITKLIVFSWEGAVLRANTLKNIKSLFVFRELVRDFLLK
ncbi:MAG: TetR/AcrR family transcriptional regulator [Bacteroidales bacterium]|jgi:TetR/AcrR family transcriptional repressor of nem operon|nr:TetR/AcrR family transcriptional regulator [Bacteroidales bacterium]MDD4214398.1 TetR/AcrR family transcriptional regulator [Bacteroidales bacterium]